MGKVEKETDKKYLQYQTGDIQRSNIEHLRLGTLGFVHQFKTLFRSQKILALLVSVAASLTIGGNVGTVKVDPINYVPIHDISLKNAVVYIIGMFVTFFLLMVWKGNVFARLENEEAVITVKRNLYEGLRCVQLMMLMAIVFGVPLAVIGWLAFHYGLWIGALALLWLLYVLPLIHLVTCFYLWGDLNFRHSLFRGVIVGSRYWGRLFLLLCSTYSIALIGMLVFCMPGFILKLVVYDNQTTLAMGEKSDVPGWVFGGEYICLEIGFFCMLFIQEWICYCFRSLYKTILELLKNAEIERTERHQFMEEQRQLKQE